MGAKWERRRDSRRHNSANFPWSDARRGPPGPRLAGSDGRLRHSARPAPALIASDDLRRPGLESRSGRFSIGLRLRLRQGVKRSALVESRSGDRLAASVSSISIAETRATPFHPQSWLPPTFYASVALSEAADCQIYAFESGAMRRNPAESPRLTARGRQEKKWRNPNAHSF